MKREVEIVPLWKVTAWDKKFNAVDKSMQEKIIKYKYLLANELNNLIEEGGNIRILYTTKDIAYTTEEKAKEFISEGEIVAIPWGGNATVKYYKGKFVTGDNRIATSLDTTVLDNKYLYYVLLSRNEEIESYYRGAGIKHPSMIDVLTMQIPLPSLSEQQRIVDILDKFEGMVENVEKELLLRQKQYEFYREKVMQFDEAEIKWKTISEVASHSTGLTYKPSDVDSTGILVLRSSNIQDDKLCFDNNVYVNMPVPDKSKVKQDDVLICVRNGSKKLVGKAAIITEAANEMAFGAFMNRLRAININSKYLFYVWNSEVTFNQYKGDDGAPINQILNKDFDRIKIPVPSLSKQQEIVAKLDKFEEMISTLKKELELRKKQYEYYREKLLTFE